jgi:ribonuclease VapC
MIIDSSALVAIVREEAEADPFLSLMENGRVPLRMSAGSYLETGIVIDGAKKSDYSDRFDELVERLGIEIIPVTAEHARIARRAYREFGKGSGHAAQLNFGDCFAYALSWESGEPLLFKGQDFNHTDIEAVS